MREFFSNDGSGLKTCAEVDEKTTHVCVGRDEFTKSKIEEWRSSGKTPGEIMHQQLKNGGVVDAGIKEYIAESFALGTLAGQTPKKLTEARPEQSELINKALTEDGAKFDFDRLKALDITLAQYSHPMMMGDVHQQIILPQIAAAHQKENCDVEIIMFGDAHLSCLHDELKEEYPHAQIIALSKHPMVIGENATHPLKMNGVAHAYDASGSVPNAAEEKLNETCEIKRSAADVVNDVIGSAIKIRSATTLVGNVISHQISGLPRRYAPRNDG